MAAVASAGEKSVLWIGSEAAQALTSIPLAELMDETTFEQRLAGAAEVLGEDLLVIGRQLVDFEGDTDRLDLLAIDAGGDLVLIELKVDEKFRFTDLQALAYAGPYAQATAHTSQLAQTLLDAATASEASRKHVPQPDLPSQASLEDAKDLICKFLDQDAFEEWTPSPKVRIKLIAPGFPDRVLATVDWLESFHELRIEAIQVSAYKIGDGVALSFNTLRWRPGPRRRCCRCGPATPPSTGSPRRGPASRAAARGGVGLGRRHSTGIPWRMVLSHTTRGSTNWSR